MAAPCSCACSLTSQFLALQIAEANAEVERKNEERRIESQRALGGLKTQDYGSQSKKVFTLKGVSGDREEGPTEQDSTGGGGLFDSFRSQQQVTTLDA